MKDKRLEKLSVLASRGVPLGFSEILEVIDYQEKLAEHRKIGFWNKIKTMFHCGN